MSHFAIEAGFPVGRPQTPDQLARDRVGAVQLDDESGWRTTRLAVIGRAQAPQLPGESLAAAERLDLNGCDRAMWKQPARPQRAREPRRVDCRRVGGYVRHGQCLQ